MHIWKQRLGSDATYQKLINIFERAGHHTYAEVVRNIACDAESETDDFHDDDTMSQPETYPPFKSSHPSSTECSEREPSTCDEYLLINPAIAQRFPKGNSAWQSSVNYGVLVKKCSDIKIIMFSQSA